MLGNALAIRVARDSGKPRKPREDRHQESSHHHYHQSRDSSSKYDDKEDDGKNWRDGDKPKRPAFSSNYSKKRTSNRSNPFGDATPKDIKDNVKTKDRVYSERKHRDDDNKHSNRNNDAKHQSKQDTKDSTEKVTTTTTTTTATTATESDTASKDKAEVAK